ncbi:hypothetical protein [Rhodoplanes elegans]|uniref:hypothetical protein n=1 Tax=Rhodoplanes elegans TaxID=29408 RepID=UPI001913CC33|nr:hypothetical protein [Rhodoplanes elegans]
MPKLNVSVPRSAVRRPLVAAIPVGLLLAGPAVAQPVEWAKMPRMQLERQFAGPLADTVIQRWRDPADGTVCYVYLPINVPHSAPTQSGYVQYGPASIGSISCMAGTGPGAATSAPNAAAPRRAPATPNGGAVPPAPAAPVAPAR